MARVAACAFVAGLFTSVLGLMEFINPPPFGEIGDMSNSDTYRVGNTVNVAWTPGDEGGGVSLCLYQQNETDGMWFGDMEYLTRKLLLVEEMLVQTDAWKQKTLWTLRDTHGLLERGKT
jgi:hypothetical protein